jgi:ACS family glucarate transporter-like MFS transporter
MGAVGPEIDAKSNRFTIPALRYILVTWLLVLSTVAYLDRTNISIAGIQIGRQLGIDNIHLGWIFSAFLIGYAAFQVAGGVLARRLGPRRVLFYGLLWWAVFTSLTALAPSHLRNAWLLLMAVRFALGAGEAVLYPAASQFVERWFPVEERGRANGIVFAGVGIGAGLTPPLVTAIIISYGWRAPFWFSAVVGVAAAGIWYAIARDTPEQHHSISQRELAFIEGGRVIQGHAVELTALSDVRPSVPWAAIFSSKEVIVTTLSYFAYCYCTWIFFGWFYIYLVQVRGLDLKTSALYSVLPFLAMTAGSILGGVLSDKIAEKFGLRSGRCWLGCLAMGIASALLIAASRASSGGMASIIAALSMGTLYLSSSCFWATANDIAGRLSSVVSGLMNTGGQIGGAVAASLTPLVAHYFGWRASFMVAAVLGMLGAVSWLVVNPAKRLDIKVPAAEHV